MRTPLALVTVLLLLVAALIAVVLVALHRGPRRASSDAAVLSWWRRCWLGWRVRRAWPVLMRRVGLTVREQPRTLLGTRPTRRSTDAVERVPALGRLFWHGGTATAEVVLLLGQTCADLQAVVEAVRQGTRAATVRVTPSGRSGTRVAWGFLDPLAVPFSYPWPDSHTDTDTHTEAAVVAPSSLEGLRMGRCEDGSLWRLRLGPHTLVAGSSGSGKASLVWGLMFALAPAIHAGLVQVHGIDLKGGMELGMGSALFTRYAATPATAVRLLEDAAAAMHERSARLAGSTRQHTPTTGDPQVVVLIDELAALTAYLSDRDLTRRANAALALLCSQGRAPGYTVFACLQDPRKETIPIRGLFTQMVGLRLKDREETTMVLGPAARDAGAACHTIATSTPGVGYLVPETGGVPVRVRGALITDHDIRQAATRYRAPTHEPIRLVHPDSEGLSLTKPARPRNRRTEVTR